MWHMEKLDFGQFFLFKMSRVLPRDVKNIIFSYFTLPVLQEWHQVQPNFPFKALVKYTYGPKAAEVFNQSHEVLGLGILPIGDQYQITSKLLSPFEFYLRQQLLAGEIGYDGHLYMPM